MMPDLGDVAAGPGDVQDRQRRSRFRGRAGFTGTAGRHAAPPASAPGGRSRERVCQRRTLPGPGISSRLPTSTMPGSGPWICRSPASTWTCPPAGDVSGQRSARSPALPRYRRLRYLRRRAERLRPRRSPRPARRLWPRRSHGFLGTGGVEVTPGAAGVNGIDTSGAQHGCGAR
jgi:hypothetical protein